MTEPDDQRLMRFLKTGVPPTEVGRLSNWNGLNAVTRASHPIGLINAGDPDGAVRDVADIGRLYFAPTDVGLIWAGVYDAAIAAALGPDATIESVIETALGFATAPIKKEIDRALDAAARIQRLRGAACRVLHVSTTASAIPYAMASAAETVSKALALFVHTKADPKQAILAAVNFGRDTDCLAATAGGLAGALSGADSIPAEWIEQLDAATAANPYTNTVCTVKEHADGIHSALRARAARMRELVAVLES